MKVLGISFGHSAAAALLVNGEIVGAVEEDKISRIKGNLAFPHKAIEYVLGKGNLKVSDIDQVAIGCTNIMEFGSGYRQLSGYFNNNSALNRVKGLFHDGMKRYLPMSYDITQPVKKLFFENMVALGFSKDNIQLVDHHKAHVASAYYTSPWKDAAIVTNDGKGDGYCGSFYLGENNSLKKIDEVLDHDSIGQFYQSVTKFLGYKVNRHEGKITGLAAFGDSNKTYSKMKEVFEFDGGNLHNKFYDDKKFNEQPLMYYLKNYSSNGSLDLNYLKYIKSLPKGLMNFAICYEKYMHFLKEEFSNLEPKDLAAGIQRLSEETLVSYVKRFLKDTKVRNVCLAGGVFANVKINQRIAEIDGVDQIFVQPAMDDAGTALGAALSVYYENNDEKEFSALSTVYLGPSYSEKEMEDELKKFNLSYKRYDNAEEVIGRLIHAGKIVGRFNGGLEWGPRALGNRSIIARPTDKSINDTLNERLNRTEFMPFAPSMLDVDAHDILLNYSKDDIAARYMTVTYDVDPSRIDQIQATVHIDGTARPQVVFREDNESYYKIIEEYKKLSGFGVIINTSFNMHEEPIVNSPNDAIRAYNEGAVDVLSLGPFIVERESNA